MSKKNVGVAYVLWFFLGGLGIHRLYLGRTGSGVAMLLITIFLFLIAWPAIFVWWIVDAFLIPGMARS